MVCRKVDSFNAFIIYHLGCLCDTKLNCQIIVHQVYPSDCHETPFEVRLGYLFLSKDTGCTEGFACKCAPLTKTYTEVQKKPWTHTQNIQKQVTTTRSVY